jgi:branched-chain amino acid transport system ATP-binding protein
MLVPEGRHLFRSLSVVDNLRSGKLLRRGDLDIEDVFELFPRLRERSGIRAGSMSGGEQQMLAIGRAVIADPDILLVDEPSLGLAPITAQTVFESFRRLAELGKSVVVAEQNLRLSLAHAHRAVVVRGGVVVHDQECASAEGRAAAEQAYQAATALETV